MTYLLALDQGTSSSRSIVFDAQGRLIAQSQRELPQHYPQAGWVEPPALVAAMLAHPRIDLRRDAVNQVMRQLARVKPDQSAQSSVQAGATSTASGCSSSSALICRSTGRSSNR